MSYTDTRKYITDPISGERVLKEDAQFWDPETTNCPLWPYSRPDKKADQPPAQDEGDA